ncbi:MAG TPA: RNA polymerase subunit sigma-70 [Cytophagales bacterium]|nr:RNA polymerase subunit sigma-70 [Cytophagales bacterium]
MRDYPFGSFYRDKPDLELIRSAQQGSRAALEALVKRHQHYIYNVAHKMVLSPADAEDITQEVLVKLITKLGQFKGDSSFRTWLYRITFNHFLEMKKYRLEEFVTDFQSMGEHLDAIENNELTELEQAERRVEIEEAKLGCLSAMLLCLDREQRLVYVLGEIFGVGHTLGATLLNISPDNFRQRLSRARKDLYQFINRKCGLINTANPCRCATKTKGFIKAKWVDPVTMKFNTHYLHRVRDVATQGAVDLEHLLDTRYASLFRAHPFQQRNHVTRLFRDLLNDERVKATFGLNGTPDN